jgi:hypothetical protein
MKVMNFAETHKCVQLKQHVFKKKIPEDFTKLAKVLNKKELSEVLSKSKNWTTQVWT